MIGLLIFGLGMIIPIIMMLFGGVASKENSTEMSAFSGYRTKWALKSKGTWDYAQKLSGRVWVITGALSAVFALVLGIIVAKNDDIMIAKTIVIMFAVQIVLIWLTYIPVETMLRCKFDEDGNLRVNVKG